MEKKLTFIKSDFSGGMNRQNDSTKLQENQYPLLVNARCRYNAIEPILKPRQESNGLPASARFQGVYAAGSIILVFAYGRAYYRDYNAATETFMQVPNLLMDASVDTIFVEFVPASNRNFSRSISGAPNSNITLGNTITQTPQCAIVQDGVNQPWIINSDGTARVTQNYNQWTTTNREYVPIGKQMLYHNGILYIVSSNGTQIYRSVTGRPLDFVVAVDDTGNKAGDASAVSHAVDYGAITCLKSLNTDANAIFVGTAHRSYMMVPDVNSTIFGEPTFNNIPLFTTGPLNQFSFIELLGDSAFITFSGMRSFNAVMQLKREGKNAPFNSEIAPLLQDIIQQNVAAVNFDDYAIFHVNTVYGNVSLIYDTLIGKWTAVDKLSGIPSIKQFAEIKTVGTRKLFFITATGLYEYFGDTSVEKAGWYFGDFITPQVDIQHKPELLNLVFSEPLQVGEVNTKVFVDSMVGTEHRSAITNIVAAQSAGMNFPFGISSKDRIRVIKQDINRNKTGHKLGVYIEWDFNAKLLAAQLDTHTEENTENQVAATNGITITGIYVNGINVLVPSLTEDALAAAIATVNSVLQYAITGTAEYAPNNSNFVPVNLLPTNGVIEIHVDSLTEDIESVTFGGVDVEVINTEVIYNPDGSSYTVITCRFPPLTPEDGSIIIDDYIIGPPVIITPPPVDGGTDSPSSSTDCSFEVDITNAVMVAPDLYVLTSAPSIDPRTTPPVDGALLFSLLPNGNYQFLSPLCIGNFNTATTSSIGQMGKEYDFSTQIHFQVNGKVFCVSGPDTVVEPPPITSIPTFICDSGTWKPHPITDPATDVSCSACCSQFSSMAIGDIVVVTTCFTCGGFNTPNWFWFQFLDGSGNPYTYLYEARRMTSLDGSLTSTDGCQFYEVIRVA